MSESVLVNYEVLCTYELFLYMAKRGWNKRAGEGRGRRRVLASAWKGWSLGSTPGADAAHLWASGARPACCGARPAHPGPEPAPAHPPAVGGHVGEDSEQELASVAWLEGGGDDDVAALRLVCTQEDAA